jgi:hypothetical protein
MGAVVRGGGVVVCIQCFDSVLLIARTIKLGK